MKERSWIAFYHAGQEILRISKSGLHEGELQATIDLLAYERGISEGDIEFAEVSKSAKEELIVYGEESDPLKKDERAEWHGAALLAEGKARVRIQENGKQMVFEKARQSARRKKRKRFDAW